MGIVLAALKGLAAIGKIIQAVELWLAYKAGLQHQVLADKSADIAKLQAEANAVAQAGTAQEALKKGDF